MRALAYVAWFLKHFPGFFFLFCFPCWRAGVLSSMPFVVGGKPSVFIGVNKSLDLQLFKSRGYIHPDYVVQKNSYSSKT